MVKLRNPPVFYKKRDCDRRNDRNDYQYDHQLRQSKSFFLCVFHLYSSFIRCFQHLCITFYYMMWVSKVPNYDAYGLFRALHSHNPFYAPLRSVLNMCHWHIAPKYSHIVGLSSHFYVYAPLRSEQNEHPLDVLLHIGAGPKVFHPPMSKLMWI